MNFELENLILSQSHLSLSPEQRQKVFNFYQILVKENEVQNLTRLTSPPEFVEGHLIDVLELMKSRFLVDAQAIDLGSGGGVPGLLAALLDEKGWILVEAEKRKAEFLKQASHQLGLDEKVSVFAQRIEDFLSSQTQSRPIVARAVGPVDRIYSWIRGCSTWNTLILFKGPSWELEWSKFLETKYRKELSWVRTHEYGVGPERKVRRIVELKRVPRGTRA